MSSPPFNRSPADVGSRGHGLSKAASAGGISTLFGDPAVWFIAPTPLRSIVKKAVVLLSGGLDSSTALATAVDDRREVYTLTVDYGQRHKKELQAAKRLAKHFGVKEHKLLKVNLTEIGGSALTDKSMAVPEKRTTEEIGHGIPVTYVPARNTVLLGLALGYAEVVGADEIYIAANAIDYSVDGDARVWVKAPLWTRLMPIMQFYELPEGDYQTLGLDLDTLRLEWRRVTGRFRHRADLKRCFKIRLERGQEICVTEDHSLFTIDPATARLVRVEGSLIKRGMPIIVPFDLSGASNPSEQDKQFLDLSGLPQFCRELSRPWSLVREDGNITNRLHRTLLPVHFPITDDFLYIIGLWLAEGGKDLASRNPTLAFSIGSIPGAVETLRSYFGQFSVAVGKSPQNSYDYRITSSPFAGLFDYFKMFGTSRRGEKAFPPFFWDLSQRQRRVTIAGLWDGDGSHVFKREAVLSQKSHELIREVYHCFTLDGIFPIVRNVRHGQKQVVMCRAHDFRKFIQLYPLRHSSKRLSLEIASSVAGRDQATGLWKSQGLWDTVAAAHLGPGMKTRIYNSAGKYDQSFRARRSVFASVPSLSLLASSPLAFLRVADIKETQETWMYDLSVEGAENFVANGILAHNSGYPDCRPEYFQAFQRMANLATKRAVEGSPIEVRTPLIHMTKAQIVLKGKALGVPFEKTWSCYLGGEKACGRCDSCILRLKGFREAGLEDPLEYERRIPAS